MVSSLRYTVNKKFGKLDYLHYFRRMIRDYENGLWSFDIRTVVRKIKVEIPCPKYVCKKGFSKRLCWTICDDEIFEKEFSKYLNGYIYPIQEIRKNKILARKVWISKYGFFTKDNQNCSASGYNCKICKSKFECELSKKYTKKDDHFYKMTRIFEILYGNLNKGYWASFLEDYR